MQENFDLLFYRFIHGFHIYSPGSKNPINILFITGSLEVFWLIIMDLQTKSLLFWIFNQKDYYSGSSTRGIIILLEDDPLITAEVARDYKSPSPYKMKNVLSIFNVLSAIFHNYSYRKFWIDFMSLLNIYMIFLLIFVSNPNPSSLVAYSEGRGRGKFFPWTWFFTFMYCASLDLTIDLCLHNF